MDKETQKRFENFIGNNLKTLPIAQIGNQVSDPKAQSTPQIAEENQNFTQIINDIKSLHESLWQKSKNSFIEAENAYEEIKGADRETAPVWRGIFRKKRSESGKTILKMNELADHAKSPYFGRIDFKFSPENEFRLAGTERAFYIGKKGLELENIKITDWRAPISSLYYNFPKAQNDAFYKVDERMITGDLKLKRMIDIKDAVLQSVFDSSEVQSLVGADPFLLKQLKGGSSSKLKDIVSTIQTEQNQIISAEIDKDIIVQGVAGSGKTSIATHRLSWLLYNYKNEILASKCLILAPSKLFLSYIAEILPEIGSEKVPQKTFYEWALAKLPDMVKPSEIKEEDPDAKEKGNLEFIKKVEKLAKKLKARKQVTLAEAALAYKTEFGFKTISKFDLAPLLYLKTLIRGFNANEYIHYLVVDEAQDYMPSEIFIMRQFTRTGRLMIVGDVMQGIINPDGVQTWSQVYGEVFDKKKTSYFNIQTSYRTTKQIIKFVNEFLLENDVPKALLPKAVLREGPEPSIIHDFELNDFIEELPKIYSREKSEGRNNIVIITPKKYLDMFYDEIKAALPEAKLIDEPEDLYEGGVVVTDVKTVKGLEFDTVIFLNFSETNINYQSLKEYYVACTRAMHKLYVVEF